MKKLSMVILLFLIISPVAEAGNVNVNGWTTKKAIRRKKALKNREAEMLYRQAEEQFLKNNYQQAIDKLKNIESLHPRDRYADDALLLAGVSYLKEENWQKAREKLKKLLGQYPKSNLLGKAELSLGDSFYLAKDIDGAIFRYKQFLINNSQNPLLAEVYFKLGRCYQKKGRWSEAKYYFEKVYADYPLSFEAAGASGILTENGLFFTIQMGSFLDKTNALKTRDKLKNEGYQAYISEVREKGKLLYRVRIGEFDTQGEADYIAKELKEKGYSTRIYP